VADSRSTERAAAEHWFLAQGLPAVLRPGALVHRVWRRSAPALAGYAMITANSVLVGRLAATPFEHMPDDPTVEPLRRGELLDSWTRGDGTSDGHLLGMTLPVPEALIQTSMFLTALTFMYLAAKAVEDKEYRAQFVDPLIETVRVTLVARDRYRLSLRATS